MSPLAETSCGQGCYYFGQVGVWSDVLPAETSCGQVCYYLGQVNLWSDVPPRQRHIVVKHITTLVRLTSGQMYPNRDNLWPSVLLLWSDVSPTIRVWVRLTFSQVSGQAHLGQMYPLAETSCGQVCNYFCQVDLWSDVPPGRDILWPSVLLLLSGWPLVRCIPRQRHLVAKCVTTSVRLSSG